MLHSHYDRLKIARDAPIEVVRAAYRALSLKYHPDRNPGDSEAARNMALLNAAYEVLSDPEKRREHDAWIRSVESASQRRPAGESHAFPYTAAFMPPSIHGGDDAGPLWASSYRRRYPLWGGIALLVVLAGLAGSAVYRAMHAPHPVVSLPAVPEETTTPRQSAALDARQLWPTPSPPGGRSASPPKPPASSSGAAESTASPTAMQANGGDPSPSGGSQPNPRVKPPPSSAPHTADASIPTRSVHYDEPQARPDTAPNGERWPQTSDYVRGYEVLYTNGGSELVIDNSRNNFDVFLKLVSVTDPEPKTVRSVFVLAHGQFSLRHIRAGTYEVRYHQLGSGTLLRSSTFALDESAIAGGTRYSIVTLIVQKAADESANAYPLAAEEFEQ
jgi:hypothetical protein